MVLELSRMADPWRIAGVIISFVALLSPFFVFLCNKVLAYLSVDVAWKLKKLEIRTIPDLKKTLMRVQEQMMVMRAARRKGFESDLNTLEETKKDLKSKLYDAEDILDLIDYHRIEKKVIGDRIIWVQRLRDAAPACIACCKGWFGRFTHIIRDARLRCAQVLWDQPLVVQLCRWASPGVTPDPEAPGNPEEPQTSSQVQAPHFGGAGASWEQRIYTWFCRIYNCCGSILSWPANMVLSVYNIYWNRSCEVLGIKHNKKDGIGLDSFQLTIHGKSLRERMEQIDSIITLSKELLARLNEQSSSSELSINDTDKEKSSSSSPSDQESRSKRKEIDDMHRSIIAPKVFGREKDQMRVSHLLREEASSRYSVIGIHGIAGSGKTTLARYVCDYEKETENKNFDRIMFIQLSKTFRLYDIFIDMLMELVGQDEQSKNKDLESLESKGEELKEKLKAKSVPSLCAELKGKLKGKRFLLVLDDLWLNDDENQNKEIDILLDALAAGDSGSRILVTAQTKDAAAALGAREQILIPDLEENEYLSLFMYHALKDTDDSHGEYERIGTKIAEKLHRSPIAAVTVAKRLQRNKSNDFWKATANLDLLNETMGALWWSYQQLGPDVRQCFEYCSIFPRGYELRRDEVVNLWMAQGFLKTSNGIEEPEDVGKCYFNELRTRSFLQKSASPANANSFIIHDLLHELAEKVAGSDFFRIGPNGFGCLKANPQEVRHLFIETYDRAETTVKKILEFENLRTLIIDEKYGPDDEKYWYRYVEEKHDLANGKLFEGMFTKMMKLRVLKVKVEPGKSLVIPESIGQMKHLRFLFLHIYCHASNNTRLGREILILPRTFNKLYHMQILNVDGSYCISHHEDVANNRTQRFMIGIDGPFFPNVGQLTSLKSLETFMVRNEQGYELKQLRHLNKLGGFLEIRGLENVTSKDEALEAKLADKKELTSLTLAFSGRGNPDVGTEVLDGLVPPKDLETLRLIRHKGSRYPNWMSSPDNTTDALEDLWLQECSPLASIPEHSVLFAGLRNLIIRACTWDTLPDHMERLTMLKVLQILECSNIELLPILPRSLEWIAISGQESKLWSSFQEETHINRQRIEHIRHKLFHPPITDFQRIRLPPKKNFVWNANTEKSGEFFV